MKIHTERFKWYDAALIVLFIAAAIMIFSHEIIGGLLISPFMHLYESDETGFWQVFCL